MEAEPDLDTLCDLLQSNDPNTTKAGSYGNKYAVDYGRIGRALQGNTHVTDLCVYLILLLDSSRDDDETSFETVDENELFTRGEKWAELILQYISSSTVLRKLSLPDEETMGGINGIEYRVASRLAGLFFQAVASNTSIERLEIERWVFMEASYESFGMMLQQTQSLRQLQIPLPDPDTPHRSVEWLGGAFRSNSSLEALVIGSEEFNSPIHCAVVIKEILSSLRSHPKIQELCLRYHREIAMETAEDLCRFLGATSTLNRLDIDYSYITVEAMQRLIDGLRSNRGTIHMLGLPHGNILPSNTCRTLMTYLTSKAGASNGLNELRYSGTHELDALAESLLIPDSIGSGLRHLELGFGSAPFLDVLSTHGCRSKLETLQIAYSDGTAEALWRCIPTLVRLRELRVDLAAFRSQITSIFRRVFRRLAEALKKNGSLFKVTCTVRFGDPEPDPPGCRKRRYLDALGQRNEKVPRMLSRPRIEHEHQQEDSANDMTDIKQFPSLFAAALDAEQMSPNTFLIGLASSQDEVGYHKNGEKRSSRAT